MKISIHTFPFADNFVSWWESFSWTMNLFCLYLVLVSCCYRLQKWMDFPFGCFCIRCCTRNLAFSRLLVIAVCSLCSTNCCSMATKGCWECFSCSNGNCRADHYFTACWIFFSQGVYLSVRLCLSKTTCYHWWRNRIWVRCDSKDWVSGKFAAPDLVWQCTAFPSIRLQWLEFHHNSTVSGIPLLSFKLLCKWH